MLLALIIKLFQKMWPKLGRQQSWRVSMHAPFGNFAWAPHHCRGTRGGYESLLHPGSPGGFSICLPLAVPSLSSLIPADTSSQMCPFCCWSTPKAPHLRVPVERTLLAGTSERLRAAVRGLVCGRALLHTAFHTWSAAPASSCLGVQG